MADAELRQRKEGPQVVVSPPAAAVAPATKPTRASSPLSPLRIVVLVALALCGYLAWDALLRGERTMTLEQLKVYDGSDPRLPVWLSIDGDVYDVSANRRVYGKGGSYNTMAGRDASRAFITGCFTTHQTHDLRGLSDKELGGLQTWKDFFANSPKYPKVGRVVLPEIDPQSPIPEPCAEQKTHH